MKDTVRDLLLDTHIVIWMAISPRQIPVRLLHAIEQAERRLVSHVTALEIQLKNLKNPAAFPFSLRHLEASMKEFSCTELPLSYSDTAALSQMEFLHSDPFDRLLMAQSRARNLCLATTDKAIHRTFERHRGFPLFPQCASEKRSRQ